jgi:hypothetical protein
MAIAVESYGTYGVVSGSSKGQIAFAVGCGGLSCSQTTPLAINDEFAIFDQLKAKSRYELLRPFSNEIHVRTLAEDQPGGSDRIANSLHASDSSGTKSVAIHDQGIHLYFSVGSQETTAAGIESLVIFHDYNGFLDGFKR